MFRQKWAQLQIVLIILAVSNIYYAAANEELLETNCVSNEQCEQFLHRDTVKVECINDSCKCMDAKNQSTKCQPNNNKVTNFISGACPCTLPNSECNKEQNICYCKPHFQPSHDKRRCLPSNVTIGNDCEMSAQCLIKDTYSECDTEAKKCVCRDNFIAVNNKCISYFATNTSCSNDDDCKKFGDHTTCLQEGQIRKCVCQEGFVRPPLRNKCMPTVRYHESCSEDLQCKHFLGVGGKCIHGACSCDCLYYPDEVTNKKKEPITKCFRKVELGKYCRTETDCYQSQFSKWEQTMGCQMGECNCRPGFLSINVQRCARDDATTLKPSLFILSILTLAFSTLYSFYI